MEIILLEKVENLGDIGDRVNVRAGFGRNFLLPKGKATLATSANIAEIEARRAEIEARQAAELTAAQTRAAQLEALAVKIPARAGVDDKLFGSVGTVDIAQACTQAGVEVQRSEVRLPNGPLRSLGEHEVEFHLHPEVNASLSINVVDSGEVVPAGLDDDATGSLDTDSADPTED